MISVRRQKTYHVFAADDQPVRTFQVELALATRNNCDPTFVQSGGCVKNANCLSICNGRPF